MSLATRLYYGETRFDLIGARKRWYAASAVLLLICTLSMVLRGFNFGIEFSGGNSFQFPTTGRSVEQARTAVEMAEVEVVTAQRAGGNFLIKTQELTGTKAASVKTVIAREFDIAETQISDNSVSSSWGDQITRKAGIALVVFLFVVIAYLSVRFEPKMAVAAIAALIHDLWLTAGLYSIVGFEVTPSTVIGLLTILGFSLYDTVVVFDKVEENTRGILGGSRMTYSAAANLAVNQTFMRSINTSLIALLPVAGLLFIGAGLLGAGTLKDLGLVLFVGLAAGAYSSLFLATPILAELKEREPQFTALRQRVLSKGGTATALSPLRATAGPAGGAAPPAPSRRATAVLERSGAEPGDTSPSGDPLESGKSTPGSQAGESVKRAGGTRPVAPRQPTRRKGGRPGRPSGKRKR